MPLTAKDNSAMTPSEVRAIQTRLKALGYSPGAIDGIMGPRTNSAVIAYKRDHGLKPRAWIGPLTWDKLHQTEIALNERIKLPWMVEAMKAMNRHEVYDNKWLRDWLRSDGHTLGDPARLPWCGDFVETAIRLGLPKEPIIKNPYWALNWLKWGQSNMPTYGAVFAIKRSGGGHVGFLVGQDATRYFCAGGNQGNKTSVVPVDKSRFTPASFRWPSTFPVQPIHLPRMTSAQASNMQES